MFCGHAGYFDEFCFHPKRIEKRHFDYARNSYRNEFTNFLPHSYSRAPPRTLLVLCLASFMDLTIAHMFLAHERTTLHQDALVTVHILIVLVVSHIGMVFLLEGLTLTLSLNTLTVHVFPIVVLIPLVQRVRC
jgi:hypothetical protein